ncbi:hypothetical protein GDO86_006445 [Hymenochirus boettgeri]|uniref:Uncharacterized protein n=1 Tax=Hymenochirus boettgeri TaxID=247094 RepID=A0A8T2J662_9PIPI|nr:hypothetical protein GDO86_006445 [Hymenochirus boettgeri]
MHFYEYCPLKKHTCLALSCPDWVCVLKSCLGMEGLSLRSIFVQRGNSVSACLIGLENFQINDITFVFINDVQYTQQVAIPSPCSNLWSLPLQHT